MARTEGAVGGWEAGDVLAHRGALVGVGAPRHDGPAAHRPVGVPIAGTRRSPRATVLGPDSANRISQPGRVARAPSCA